MTGSPGK